MPEDTGKTIRVPVAPPAEGHTIRTIIISRDQGIKALYDVTDKKVITYLFDKNKDWDMKSAQKWVNDHKKTKSIQEISVDQEKEFIKVAFTYEDDTVETFEPSYGTSFVMTKELMQENLTVQNGKKEESIVNEEKSVGDELEILKTDAKKQLVYGVFLWPEKADHDGDIISSEDIEKVAHGFIVEYRDIDEMHSKSTMDADIVESFIAWVDGLEFYGKKLSKGAWAGAIHIKDPNVWAKVEKGEYKGFSVRISGHRIPVDTQEEN